MSGTPHEWADNEQPTPEQLAHWLTRCTDDERLRVARIAIGNSELAGICFREDHEGQIDFLSAEVRRLVADIAAIQATA